MAELKTGVTSPNAPKALGPYSQAIQCGNLLFLSGQVPLDPHSGTVLGDTIEVQTERVLKNIAAVLEAAGVSMGSVLKTTVFLKDMNDFQRFNEIYAKYFDAPYPARSTVQVVRLPKDVLIEIEAIAVLSEK